MAFVFSQVVEVLKPAINSCATQYVRLSCGHKAHTKIGATEWRCKTCEKETGQTKMTLKRPLFS